MLFFNAYLRSTMKGYMNFSVATFLGIRTVIYMVLTLITDDF